MFDFLKNEVNDNLHEVVAAKVVDDRKDFDNAIKMRGSIVINTLDEFGVQARIANIVKGPTTVQYQLKLAPATKLSKVSGLVDEIAMALSAESVRIETPIPGLPYVGVEIPNPERKFIKFDETLDDDEYINAKGELPIPIGVGVDGKMRMADLTEMPHLLVAGTTGSGKSVFLNNILISLMTRYNHHYVKFVLVDPKMVEFSSYICCPHVNGNVITESFDAVEKLKDMVQEMENRLEIFAKAKARNIKEYNAKVSEEERMPYYVVVIDEMSDLMCTAKKDVEKSIVRLAQKARAAGIHLILATQRPSVNVVTGLIKANIPTRVAFSLPSSIDSKTILDTTGAEKLLGKGDMLINEATAEKPRRYQSPYTSDDDMHKHIASICMK